MAERLTPEEHKTRHLELHQALDELYADYLAHNLPRAGDPLKADFFPVSLNDLMAWSFKQTQSPDELDHD